jgi:hypothetical protein
MKRLEDVVIWGMGQLGAVFATGLLELGYRVTPVTRQKPVADVIGSVPEPAAVIVAVGEASLPEVLSRVPESWQGRLVLVQNELLPYVWEPYSSEAPTVVVVWFEKKKGTVVRSVQSTRVFGPNSALIQSCLDRVVVPCDVLPSFERLCFELVLKNVYILTINAAGLAQEGDVGTLWQEQRGLMESVAREAVAIEQRLLGAPIDVSQALAGLEAAILADPRHVTRGRTAPERLRRALERARGFGIEVPTLEGIEMQISTPS